MRRYLSLSRVTKTRTLKRLTAYNDLPIVCCEALLAKDLRLKRLVAGICIHAHTRHASVHPRLSSSRSRRNEGNCTFVL